MNCWHCKTELIWGGDHDIDEENDAYSIVTNLSCPKCHSIVDVYYPNEETKKDYKNMVTIVENKKEPCIYLRYFKEDLQYIGESSDTITGRPFRKTESNHQWDKCRILKAPKDKDRRRYWEAVLIVKLKPKTQKIVLYQNKLKDTNILQVKKLPYGTGGRKYVLKEISLKKKTEQMRCENNQEKMKYWAKQALVCKENIKMLEKQMTESILCYKHFKEDAEKEKQEKYFKYLREMNER